MGRLNRSGWAARIPGVGALASWIARIAQRRAGRVPVGLLMLLPLAIVLDIVDAGDELALGPVGIGISFLLETAFLLGITGRASYAFGFAGIDLIPGVDLIPFATLTLIAEIVRAWREPQPGSPFGRGPVIDV